jgi:hypothetical protein
MTLEYCIIFELFIGVIEDSERSFLTCGIFVSVVSCLCNNGKHDFDCGCFLTLGAQLLFQIPTDLSESDEYEDSDEDEVAILIIRRKRKLHIPQRIENYVERVVVNFTARQFQQHLRITVDTYEKI